MDMVSKLTQNKWRNILTTSKLVAGLNKSPRDDIYCVVVLPAVAATIRYHDPAWAHGLTQRMALPKRYQINILNTPNFKQVQIRHIHVHIQVRQCMLINMIYIHLCVVYYKLTSSYHIYIHLNATYIGCRICWPTQLFRHDILLILRLVSTRR